METTDHPCSTDAGDVAHLCEQRHQPALLQPTLPHGPACKGSSKEERRDRFVFSKVLLAETFFKQKGRGVGMLYQQRPHFLQEPSPVGRKCISKLNVDAFLLYYKPVQHHSTSKTNLQIQQSMSLQWE